MHVLVLNSLYPPNILGGAEISTMTLVEGLRATGVRVTVVSISPDGQERTEREGGFVRYYLAPINVENPYRRKRRAPVVSRAYLAALLTVDSYNPWFRRKLAGIFEAEAPDVVHSNNLFGLSPSVWHAAKSRGIPVVHTLRDHYLLCAFSHRFRGGRRCRVRCIGCVAWALPRRIASTGVDMVVGISGSILSSHIEAGYFGNAEQRVIHNAVDGPRAAPRQTLPRKPLVLGYIGQLAAIKGLELLLGAMRLMDGEFVRLLVAGDGNPEYVRRLRQRFPLQNVQWLGRVEPRDFFDKTDLLVVPSLWDEPAGRVVAEAFCNAVPVLAANRGGLPEMLGSRSAGWLFDPDCGAKGLAADIKRLMNHPELLREASTNATSRAHDFGVAEMVASYMDAYACATRRGERNMTKSM